MLSEVVDVLSDVPDGVVVDATVGGGGHSEALLASNPNLQVVGLDCDHKALTAAKSRLSSYNSRFVGLDQNFANLGEALKGLGHKRISACLFDLGVNSNQIDTPARGFSYRHDGPLDMRLDQSTPISAAEVVNYYERNALCNLLRRNADEAKANRIADAIVAARPINTTSELSAVICGALPMAVKRRKGHPARRTFQAIRIEVNQELTVLERALSQAIALLSPGGRCLVLAYHSGEDRIVKSQFRKATEYGWSSQGDFYFGTKLPATARLLWRGVRKPASAEVAANPRCRAARMRAVEKGCFPPNQTSTTSSSHARR